MVNREKEPVAGILFWLVFMPPLIYNGVWLAGAALYSWFRIDLLPHLPDVSLLEYLLPHESFAWGAYGSDPVFSSAFFVHLMVAAGSYMGVAWVWDWANR